MSPVAGRVYSGSTQGLDGDADPIIQAQVLASLFPALCHVWASQLQPHRARQRGEQNLMG